MEKVTASFWDSSKFIKLQIHQRNPQSLNNFPIINESNHKQIKYEVAKVDKSLRICSTQQKRFAN